MRPAQEKSVPVGRALRNILECVAVALAVVK